jgi:N-acetylglutamate synthase-like GNAT family acetyltransferase
MLSGNLNRTSTTLASSEEAGFRIRSYCAADQGDVLYLYHHGLLGGQLNPIDNTSDLADIEASYFRRPQDHFWVAEAKGSVIGTVAISEDAERVMNLRRLRVAPFWQLESRVAIDLIRTAIIHARRNGCLKLVFHTSMESSQAVELLDGLGLQFSRVRHREYQHLIEFYDDLYANPSNETSSGASANPGTG